MYVQSRTRVSDVQHYYAKSRPNTRMQSDRFAREIMAILALSGAARSRRLMRNPLGGTNPLSLPRCCDSSTTSTELFIVLVHRPGVS